MEAVRHHANETRIAKRRADQQHVQQRFYYELALAKRAWDGLAARFPDGPRGGDAADDSLEKIKRLLVVVLRNAATKSDPKYKLLTASNQTLWNRLLQFQEVVVILVQGAGFERRERTQTEVVPMASERDRINRELTQALDSGYHTPDRIASLVADLDALEPAATASQTKRTTEDMEDADTNARGFELCHAGAGDDGLGIKRIVTLLQAVETW